MAKVTGRKRHWSQAVLHGAAAALGGGRKVRQRVRRAVIRGGKRVINRLRRRGGALKRKKTDVVGTFVKCKDWKPKRFGVRSKKFQSFARKVNSVVYDNLPRATELYSYAWAVNNFSAGYGSNGAVKYAQFVLDPLQAAVGANNAGNSQIGPFWKTNITNPAGISTVLVQENSWGVSAAPATGPTVLSSTFDNDAAAYSINVALNKESMWRQGASSMQIQFKNIKSYAMSLEMMIVKPKKAIQSSMLKEQDGGYKTDIGVAIDTNQPEGWTTASPNGMTPLELAQMGLSRAGGSNLCLWTNPMLSLNDSTDFNDFYTITHKCKVYLPPGGVVGKTIRHGTSRLLKTAHVSQNLYDKRTSFVVIKYVPEVQLLETTAGGVVLGPGIPSGVTENESTVDLVGTLHYRMTFKQFYGASEKSNVNQYNRQVISNKVIGGQATSVHTKAP